MPPSPLRCFSSFGSIACLVVAAIASSCVGTETGNPVALSLDAEKIVLLTAGPGMLHVVGERGAASPSSATLRMLDLQGTSDFLTFDVASDGSFDATFAGDRDRWFRAELAQDTRRSNPVDVQVISPGAPERCLAFVDDRTTAAPETTVGTPVPSTVQLENRCGSGAVDVVTRLRLGASDYALVSPPGFTLGFAAMQEFALSFAPTAAGLREGVVVFETSSGEVLALSMRGVARAP